MKKNTESNKALSEFLALTSKHIKESPNKILRSAILTDPSWKNKYIMHSSLLITAFSSATTEAASFNENGLVIPPKFDVILKWISFISNRELGQTFEATIPAATFMVKEWANEHPDFISWEQVGVNIEAIFDNMNIFLMNHMMHIENNKNKIIERN